MANRNWTGEHDHLIADEECVVAGVESDSDGRTEKSGRIGGNADVEGAEFLALVEFE